MMPYRSRRTFLASCSALGTAGFPLRTTAAGSYTMRLALATPADTPGGIASLRFASAVKRRTDGQVTIEVYPSYQLAKESETTDGLLTGTIDFVTQTPSNMASLLPRLSIFDMPFLFKDVAAGFRILDGPVGAELASDMEAKGIIPLVWGENGTREFGTTTKPIHTPEDMRGLRVRVLNGALYIATFQAFGAIPVVIDSSEAYIALTQHVVDAVDYPLLALVAGKFYNVIKHVALLNQVFSPVAIYAGKRKLSPLPAPLQKAIIEEAKGIAPAWRALSAKLTADDAEILQKNGVTFTEVQYAQFRKAIEPVYAAYQSKPGADLIERINRINRV